MEWIVSQGSVPLETTIQNLSVDRKRKISALVGHFDYGVHRLLPKPAHYVTFVRHPVDRILSHYYYVLRTPHHYLHQQIISGRIDLAAYVSGNITEELENGQTRMIAGRGINCSDAEMLRKALDNIDRHFSCVGTAERFVDSLLLMAHQNGWAHPYFRDANVGSNKPLRTEISNEVIRVIESRNAVDMELYHFAQQRLEQQLQATLPDWESRKRRFLIGNRQYAHAANLRSNLSKCFSVCRPKPTEDVRIKSKQPHRSSSPDILL
ncbi:hypothetical protein CCAX7_24480 [Capsulimonas corticalis]|uniref:Uncharacterized protein n=2 Tax=Capsulimonas corticalis TaxID=2219043 RepID=A0A402CVG6_9BACT|nr:hypothetical protein CCAX7_24480 [Capsulimonas corticalis]